MEDARIKKIKALFAKAEDPAATDAERETYRAKANELIITWEIDEAKLAAAGDERLKNERVISYTVIPDGPTSYGFELAYIGANVADALGLRGFTTKKWETNSRNLRRAYLIAGFESDVERAKLLIESLIRQCLLELGTYTTQRQKSDYSWQNAMTGTDKFQAKRSFIIAYANRVIDRLTELRKMKVEETAGTGTDLVLVNREDRVDEWVTDNMKVTEPARRRYYWDGSDAGRAAGSRADIGQQRFGTAARGSLTA